MLFSRSTSRVVLHALTPKSQLANAPQTRQLSCLLSAFRTGRGSGLASRFNVLSSPTLIPRGTCLSSSFPSSLLPARFVHTTSRLTSRPVPPPTPFVPDVETFLKLIGRGMSAHASRIPSWEALFRMTSPQLQAAGVEPANQRRYLLWWRERFRRGDYGVGGDFKYVSPEGVAELRVYEQPFPPEWIEAAEAKRKRKIVELKRRLEILEDKAPQQSAKYQAQIAVLEANPGTHSRTANSRLIAVNVPAGTAVNETCPVPIENAQPLRYIKVRGAQSVAGPFIMPLKGTHRHGATLTIQEGLWEERRGRKIDGGERRRAEVRHKRRAAESRA